MSEQPQVKDSPWREWTPEYVQIYFGWEDKSSQLVSQRLADAHNAALAAERRKRAQAEAMALDSYDKAKAIRSELAAVLKQRDDFRRALEQRVFELDELRLRLGRAYPPAYKPYGLEGGSEREQLK
jgi:hypothetical protein